MERSSKIIQFLTFFFVKLIYLFTFLYYGTIIWLFILQIKPWGLYHFYGVKISHNFKDCQIYSIMNYLREFLYRPKRSDRSLIARFYHADLALTAVASELDSFDGRKDPERCASLVNKLRSCQVWILILQRNLKAWTLTF